MNPTFRRKYEQLYEGNPTPPGARAEPVLGIYDSAYAEEGHTRTICFVWQDGRQVFLSYSYLMSGQYLPGEGTLSLTFTSHHFVLKGIHLDKLFNLITRQMARRIVVTDARYNLVEEDAPYVVNEIQMARNTS